MENIKEKVAKEVATYRKGQPFTFYDVYMGLRSNGMDTTEDAVMEALESLSESLDIDPAHDLSDGWYRMWDPSDPESVVKLAALQSTKDLDLSGDMKNAIRNAVVHDQNKPFITSENPTATSRALRRRGLVEYRTFGDGDPRRSAYYFTGPLYRVLKQH